MLTKFNPDLEYGNTLWGEVSEDAVVADARKLLPSGVTISIYAKLNYGKTVATGWMYSPGPLLSKEDEASLAGRLLIARLQI